ncbi:methyltransferase domain-containing protein [Actinoplanes bogorensis]|uniref:Methyltransferase domain-containing protein n=1 Tax=Paractinoplanes bogorensis TaxID=1610840 RepID=A0ABS5YIS1_9ACTN|nr:methyltransferase domain-containing protein [Actinoplanes bogorensis]MBU2662946.1 methyltransferase domain-containing protein [Actinoplanes bogorensis]
MIDGALPYLRCPVCRRGLERVERSLRCPTGHSFDMAKQGYADLTAGRMPHVGDTAEMVADRAGFLSAGHYDFIADALRVQLDGLIVDAGAGTGHYLARVLDSAPAATGLALDVSKPALRRAARAHDRAAAVLADLWGPLPLGDGTAEVILNVFAPRNGPEFHRVLRPGGRLLVVTPAPDHLHELIAAHGLIQVDPDKAARVEDALGTHFEAETSVSLRRELDLTATETATLIGMTPSARHVSDLAATPGRVTASVRLTTYRGLPLTHVARVL